MKVYEKTIIPAHEESRVVGTKCDMCGRLSEKGENEWNTNKKDDEWSESRTIQLKNYTRNWPEGACGTRIGVDLCPICFMEKLVPWLKDQGVTINEEEWSRY